MFRHEHYRSVIRAADYLPEPPAPEDAGSPESFQLPRSESLLINLFGETPDYSDPKFEELWQEVFNTEDKETIAWCLGKGVDVLDKNNEPVSGWRDIAVMLKAIDTGLLRLDKYTVK